MEHRSPLETLFNVISSLPQGHDKPVKHAFYNAVAIFLLVLCCAAGWALYIILEPFIKPLTWALLVGSVLHPLKYKLSIKFRGWFDCLEESNTPVMLGLILLPMNIINHFSELIGSKLLKHWKIIAGVALMTILTQGIYFYTPKFIICVIWKFAYFVKQCINLLIDSANIVTVPVAFLMYLSSMILLWKPQNNIKFHVMSMLMWLLLSSYVAHQFTPFQIPIFTTLLLIIIGGFIFEIMDVYDELNSSGKPTSITDSLKYAFFEKERTFKAKKRKPSGDKDIHDDSNEKILNVEDEEKESVHKLHAPKTVSISSKIDTTEIASEDGSLEEEQLIKASPLHKASVIITEKGNIHFIQSGEKKSFPKFKRAFSQSQIGSSTLRSRSSAFGIRADSQNLKYLSQSSLSPDEYASDFYIYSVLWACTLMIVWKHAILSPIIPIPIMIYVIKHLGHYSGFWKMVLTYWRKFVQLLTTWCDDRYDAIVPIPIRGLCKITIKSNSAMKNGIKDSFDTVTSCAVIFGLIIFVICSSIFVAVQIYAEGIMLVQMTSNLINQTVVHNPELRQLLPPTFDETLDSILDNAYQYGREGISKVIRSMMNDVDEIKSEKLEKQVLELWDRIYQKWMYQIADNQYGPLVTSGAIESSWTAFVNDLHKSSEVFNVNGILEFLKQNVGTLMSLLDSVWVILKGNINILLGSFSAFISILFGGGTAVLNFFLNLIIFFTTLFYLLSSSGDLYKPVEFLTRFAPGGNRLGLALGAAVNSVFTASFKMAVFYGLWTWFIHNVFGAKIVYLPSVVAAIFGAAPFLGTYWACLPAVFDLWLGQEAGLYAILIALFQVVPTYIVDTTIYSEIQGGHPYLTGLAIAGGIFCLGLEGAIVGPLLLCGLYVAMDLSSTLFKDSPSEESLNIDQLSRLNIVDVA